MSLGTLSSRILGLARDIVLAAFFSRTVTDAFVVAFRLPNMFRRLLGEGSLAVSFIPVFVGQLNDGREDGEARARRLSDAIFTLLLSATSALSVAGFVFMQPLLSYLVGGQGYMAIPGKFEQTVFLAKIMFAYLFLVTAYAFFMALMNSLKKFFLPALAPAAFNFVLILFALIPSAWAEVPGTFLAWGVIAGGVAQVLIVAWPLWRQGYLPTLRIDFKAEGVKTVLQNMVPGLIGLGVLQLMSLINIQFASRLGEGSHSYIYWADRIMELPQSLIAVSLGAALLPTLSEVWSQSRHDEARQITQRHMRLIMFLSIPSAVGMWSLAQPIVEVLFMRGQFSVEDAELTATVVKIYAFLLVATSFHRVIVTSFYAIKNTWLPAVASVVALVAHVIIASMWVDKYGLAGLVASTTVSGILNVGIVLGAYRYFIGPVGIWPLVKSILHLSPAAITMGISVFWIYNLLWQMITLQNLPSLGLGRAVALFTAISAGVVIYFVVNKVIKQPDTAAVISLIKKRRQARRP